MGIIKLIGHYWHMFRSSITYKSMLYKAKKLQLGNGPFLIFAPHPDDEILGCGGMINMLTKGENEVHIVIMTKGENVASMSHAEASITSGLRIGLAYKANETICRGGRSCKLHILDYPDGDITYEYHTTDQIRHIIDNIKPTTIFVSSKLDLFPDHFNTSDIIHRICYDTRIEIFEYLTWFWLLHKLRNINRIPFDNLYSFLLSPEAIISKKEALKIYFDSKDEEGHHISGKMPKVMITFLLKNMEFYIKLNEGKLSKSSH